MRAALASSAEPALWTGSMTVATAATPGSMSRVLVDPGFPPEYSPAPRTEYRCRAMHEAGCAGQIPRDRACRRTAEDYPGTADSCSSQWVLPHPGGKRGGARADA